MNNEKEQSTAQSLRQEMAEISYLEIQKFFAKGVILIIHKDVDLIEAAIAIHDDATDVISVWIDDQKLIRATDVHASDWLKNNTRFMAVTVAPWVLVQEIHNC